MVVFGHFAERSELGDIVIDTGRGAGGSEQREFAAGISPSGSVTWARRVTSYGTFTTGGAGLAPGGEIVVVAAGGSIDLVGAKRAKKVPHVVHARFDPTGKLLDSRALDDNLTIQDTAFDATGAAYVGGYFDKPVDVDGTRLEPSPGVHAAFVLKLDASGAPLWARRFGAKGAVITGLALDRSGGVVVVGSAWGPLELDRVRAEHHGGADAFIASLDASGNARWVRTAGDSKDQHAMRVAVDGRGRVVVGGLFDGQLELGGAPLEGLPEAKAMFLATLEADGTPVQGKAYPRTRAHALRADAAGNVVVAAQAARDADLGIALEAPERKTDAKEDMCLFKLDPSLRPLWGRRFSDGIIAGAMLQLDARGAPALAGWMTRSFRVGPRTLEHPRRAGDDNAYLAVFEP